MLKNFVVEHMEQFNDVSKKKKTTKLYFYIYDNSTVYYEI